MSFSRRAVLTGAAGAALLGSGQAHAAPPLTLRRGINLWPWFSLTREFPAPRTDFDWPPFQLDRQVPTLRDLAQLRRAGFDFVRIPVDPGPIIAAAPRERAILLDQVMAAVALALGQDFTVVLNLHANAATHHWTPAYLFGSEVAPGFPAYLVLIAELARRLARLGPDRVALEPVNEPFQACGAAEWERVQKRMLAAARSAAPDLSLVATGACGSMIAGLAPLKAKALAVDIAFGGNYFGFVDAAAVGLSVEPASEPAIIATALELWDVLDARTLAEDVHLGAPSRIELFTFVRKTAANRYRVANVYKPGRMGRTPSGTGTSAHIALRFAQGDYDAGQPFIQESILGTEFRASAKPHQLRAGPAVLPTIGTKSFLMGVHQFYIDPADPYARGLMMEG